MQLDNQKENNIAHIGETSLMREPIEPNVANIENHRVILGNQIKRFDFERAERTLDLWLKDVPKRNRDSVRDIVIEVISGALTELYEKQYSALNTIERFVDNCDMHLTNSSESKNTNNAIVLDTGSLTDSLHNAINKLREVTYSRLNKVARHYGINLR